MNEHSNNPGTDHAGVADDRHGLPPGGMQDDTCWLTQNRTGRQEQVRDRHHGKTVSESVRRIARENAWQIGR